MPENPRVTDEERREAIALVTSIYRSPNGGAGCCLHCILDDGNTEDHFVRSTYYDEWIAERGNHPNCRRLLELLRKMKRTQREKVIRMGYPRYDLKGKSLFETMAKPAAAPPAQKAGG